MKPKVAIVIANYNYGKWLEQCLKSALAQTYENFEIILVDDKSTDDSLDTAFKVLEINKDEVIGNDEYSLWQNAAGHKVVQLTQNSGPSKARNTAIVLGLHDGCEYFTILDADDYIQPVKVEVLLNELLKFPLVEGIYADYFMVYNDGFSRYEYKRTYSIPKLYSECIVHSGCLVSKKALVETVEQTGFYDERIKGPEDYDLWLRMAERYFFLHYAAPLTFVRVTGENISNTGLTKNQENYAKGFQILNQKLMARKNGK